jgi:hypothetical protein
VVESKKKKALVYTNQSLALNIATGINFWRHNTQYNDTQLNGSLQFAMLTVELLSLLF